MSTRRKRCAVAFASPERQWLWEVELPEDATVSDAIEAARALAPPSAEIPWDTAPVGIFGEPRKRSDVPIDGDRIELYRPLRSDPRERRREQARRVRQRGKSGR